MLEKLKNWTGHILECVPRNSMEYCDDDFSYYATDQDPRELPRPEKYPNLDLPTQGKKRSLEDGLLCKKSEDVISTDLDNGCNCYNCRELAAGLAECPICLEGYRSVGVCACPHCANVTCWRCGAKLTTCPFCRRPVTTPPVRNHAMERLIAKLQLPCSPVLLREEKIKDRAEDCLTTTYMENNWRGCLLADRCCWKGDVSELATHLEVSHQVSVLVGSSITVEIGGFRSKVRASATKTRQYIVSLASYASLFLCQISLQKKRLRLEFSGVTVSTVKLNNGPKFGAWLEVCSSSRTMKGIMPISVNNGKSKELFISCDGLLSPWRNSDDQVTITITIRPLN